MHIDIELLRGIGPARGLRDEPGDLHLHLTHQYYPGKRGVESRAPIDVA
jgi:hypothetical protein